MNGLETQTQWMGWAQLTGPQVKQDQLTSTYLYLAAYYLPTAYRYR